ncbi:mechanosensitive ion channel [Desulfopila sp. IMCC35006]|uniref:mechanosensitive ion channel domain-containing protein n=1 Tax=Desulfopila sp. IMCC35006 TaxID=2569542 RepID=UPI0010AD37A2|nr:mechanosensitive ion channel domain-containing protein [Desulfopila sp. IMCC35006]TKB26251.1 mechanosensitive ion channel [Desulfopila sp. IMCC35006]
MKLTDNSAQNPAPRKLVILFFLIVFGIEIFGVKVPNILAVEPDGKLYSEQTAERDAAYKLKAEQLAKKIATVTDEKEKQGFLVQQQLLIKLDALSDKPEKPAIDLLFSEQNIPKTLSWQDVEQYLERYVGVIQEAKISAQNLENSEKQVQTLYNRLIALDDHDPQQEILQLQYAFQVRKVAQQNEIDKYLKEGMEIAQKQYPAVLAHIHLDQKTIDKQEKVRNQAKKKLQGLEDEKILATAGNDVLLQQQESLLAGYLGRELSDDERKEMHYEQLKSLKQQLQQLITDDHIHEATIGFLEEEQKNIWFHLLAEKPDFFTLTDLSGNINKQIMLLRKKTEKAHSLIYTYEKNLSTLRGGNALVGPKAEELINTLDENVRTVFTLLSSIDQRAEMLDNRGRLLDRAIDLKQSTFGFMVTKTKEATDNIFEKILSILKYPLISYSGMNVSLLLFLQVIIVLIFGIIVNRLYGHVVSRMGKNRKWSEQTVHLVQAFGKYPFVFIVAMIMLSVVGINTRSLALVAGALSVGIGFGMQTIVNNLVSGIILLFDKSIRPGDFICLGENSSPGGFRGNVVQMNIRATVLRTNDNINIIVPNADLMASQVVNWTYSDERVRFRIPFSVAYGTDIDRVKRLIKEAVLGLPVVMPEPEPQIWMASHAASSLDLLAAIWVEGQNARQPAQISDIVLTCIYKTLQKHGIEIPFPQMDLHLRAAERQPTDITAIPETLRFNVFREAATQ